MKEKIKYGLHEGPVVPLADGSPIPERERYAAGWEGSPLPDATRHRVDRYQAGTVEDVAAEVARLFESTDWLQWVKQKMNEEAGTNATAEPDESPDVAKMRKASEKLDYARRQAAAANPADVHGFQQLNDMVSQADADYRASREGAANRIREYAEKFGLSYDAARVKLSIPEPKPLTPSTA